MKILLIEDDKEIAEYIASGLREHGHEVETAEDGDTGLQMGLQSFDVMLVDRLLPGMDGIEIVKNLRSKGVLTPTLFLTALGEVQERVEGLRAGADDYLVKPFALAELLARIEALNRRAPLNNKLVELMVGDLRMNLLNRTVTRAGVEIDLQPQEFKLLEYLLRHVGQVVTRNMLLENVWGFHFDPQTSVVETHLSRLRGKIDKGFKVELLQTIRGAGYSLYEPA